MRHKNAPGALHDEGNCADCREESLLKLIAVRDDIRLELKKAKDASYILDLVTQLGSVNRQIEMAQN